VKRGRPPVPIERDPKRFEIACWWAFTESGLGSFDGARRALLAVRGGPITLQDIEGVLQMASAAVPLPPNEQDEPDAGLRRLAAKARRARPEKGLVASSGLIQGLILFVGVGNLVGVCFVLDRLRELGWGPVIMGRAERVETALRSNLPPADFEKLSSAVRRLLSKLRQAPKK
jgi:hypothetical protein